MKTYFKNLTAPIQDELQLIDMDGGDISFEESVRMIDILKQYLSDLRKHFLSKKDMSIEDEILFFKEMKPDILGLLLFFNKIHNIELKRPTGSNETQKKYYQTELNSLTYFFERNLDFYQYYRSKATYLDEHYFLRENFCHKLCSDSIQFIRDPLFSTGYDYKIAKIISNEMLRIYFNKKMNILEKQTLIEKNRAIIQPSNLKWTGSKVAAVELAYALESSRYINRGNADIKEIMLFIETCFNIDLGEYYRTYVAIKQRKKDRTPFLQSLIDSLHKRMDEDDSK